MYNRRKGGNSEKQCPEKTTLWETLPKLTNANSFLTFWNRDSWFYGFVPCFFDLQNAIQSRGVSGLTTSMRAEAETRTFDPQNVNFNITSSIQVNTLPKMVWISWGHGSITALFINTGNSRVFHVDDRNLPYRNLKDFVLPLELR